MTTEQLEDATCGELEKGLDLCGTPEKHASGAKARLDFARFNAGDEIPGLPPDNTGDEIPWPRAE